ncbi:MAG: hypothetical protein GW946_03830 [Candidatus Pacebacteria bacterium]|nr:hypothetical protein [Candidatus Paceibacterota bacterium]PIR60414.1 MAG: hypothetical protein COU67_02165 [Candidatus Pacebacteria bacterium CG10_big_fil_rev_8_21_14_0_10_44_54]
MGKKNLPSNFRKTYFARFTVVFSLLVIGWLLIKTLQTITFQNQEKMTQEPTTTASSVAPQEQWEKYVDEAFSFKYPVKHFNVTTKETMGWAKTYVIIQSTQNKDDKAIIFILENPTSREGGSSHPITSAENLFNAPSNQVKFKSKDAYVMVYPDEMTKTALRTSIAWMENNQLWRIDITADDKNSNVALELQEIIETLEF